MTSAARPTWAPAKGASVSYNKFSSRDLAAHTTLKPRRGHNQFEKRNLREELEQGETRQYFSSRANVDLLIYSDHDDDEDDKALMAELESIKKEKAELKVKEEPRSLSLKRRWDDDVVFKNQARAETKSPRRFINDTRNDFRRRFLQTYMK